MKNGGLIEGVAALGKAHPIHIKITNYGIDVVLSIADQALKTLSTDDPEVKEISQDPKRQSKMRKFVGYVKQHPDFVASTLEKIIQTVFVGTSGNTS